jgi:transporter family protein
MNPASGKNNIMVIIFAFIGMICWGITPMFVKFGLKEIEPHIGLAIRTATTTIILTGWMITDGSFVKINQIASTTLVFIVIEAILATFVGDLAYFAAIKQGEVSLVAIILSCSPLVTILCSIIFLNEAVSVTRVIGAVLIIAGIVLAMK